MAGGTLYESTGLFGESSVRAGPLDRQPTAHTALPAPMFGEDITVLGRPLWQLSWRHRIAIERDARTLEEPRRVAYPDDGWDVCFHGHRLVTSDGSARLTFRDLRTLAKRGEVTVTEDGRASTRLNELECAGDAVYANVLFTDRIVRIDSVSGVVTAGIDASDLPAAQETDAGSRPLVRSGEDR
ncbi:MULTISPECIES: glutaminyl-peptide cyclotransferase [unclassified Streptomyces]|nr:MULTISPECIES: glutaminyl-peptide cyclotransferase [unclassified Streptomyces]